MKCPLCGSEISGKLNLPASFEKSYHLRSWERVLMLLVWLLPFWTTFLAISFGDRELQNNQHRLKYIEKTIEASSLPEDLAFKVNQNITLLYKENEQNIQKLDLLLIITTTCMIILLIMKYYINRKCFILRINKRNDGELFEKVEDN